MSNVSRKSISRKLSSLKNFFSYLEEHNEIFHNPAEMVKPPKQDKKLPRIENTQDISKMMQKNTRPACLCSIGRSYVTFHYAKLFWWNLM